MKEIHYQIRSHLGHPFAWVWATSPEEAIHIARSERGQLDHYYDEAWLVAEVFNGFDIRLKPRTD